MRGALLLLFVGLVAGQQRSLSTTSTFRGDRRIAGREESVKFRCPENFGYFSDETDCTKYFLCVFGGAMHESCSPGLMYNNDLNTCDWPQNVVCNSSSKPLVKKTIVDPRTSKTNDIPVSSVDNFISSSPSRRPQSSSKARKGRILTRESGPNQDVSGTFQAEETSSHAFNVVPTGSGKNTFTPNIPPIPTTNQIAPTRTNSDGAVVQDASTVNSTDDDYYYLYYDDYIDDEVLNQASSTQAPTTPRASSSRAATRSNKPSSSQTVGRTPQRLTSQYQQPIPGSPAQRCSAQTCQLPDCFCGGTAVPGDIQPTQVPQLVLLTFDDSVNDLNKKLYEEFFERGRVNPNGCPIAATFYVSHEWTDYSQLQNLYADGHEIASHSITHSFGEQFSKEKWAKEIAGQREIMSAYAGVRMEDIRGMRAPFLAIGGDNMFQMLYEQNFTYDSSMPVYESKPPSYPYSIDHKLFHDCMIPPCPKKAWPGVWEVPMVMWTDLAGGRCSMVDACQAPADAKGIYDMLVKNFERHYTTNRAPLGLYFHSAWFTKPHHKEGFIAFLDTISSMDDVWLTTSWQALQWTRNPVTISQSKSYKPFQCDYPERPPRCTGAKVCNVWHKGSVRYMKSCQACPKNYPWVGSTGVQSPLNNV